ncbi:MAG: hypothetical protein ABNH02_04465 [Pseudomonadales bacterium]
MMNDAYLPWFELPSSAPFGTHYGIYVVETTIAKLAVRFVE